MNLLQHFPFKLCMPAIRSRLIFFISLRPAMTEGLFDARKLNKRAPSLKRLCEGNQICF